MPSHQVSVKPLAQAFSGIAWAYPWCLGLENLRTSWAEIKTGGKTDLWNMKEKGNCGSPRSWRKGKERSLESRLSDHQRMVYWLWKWKRTWDQGRWNESFHYSLLVSIPLLSLNSGGQDGVHIGGEFHDAHGKVWELGAQKTAGARESGK